MNSRDGLEDGILIGERRRISLLNRIRRWRKRHIDKLFWVALTAAIGVGINQCAGVTRSFAEMPGEVRSLKKRFDVFEPKVIEALAKSDSLQRGQSIEVAWKCLDYAVTDTARYRASELPCGEAFFASRLDPEYWGRVVPRKVR